MHNLVECIFHLCWHFKFAQEQEEGRQGDYVTLVLEIQESDTNQIYLDFVLRPATRL